MPLPEQERMPSPNADVLYDGEPEFKTSENIHILNW
jgi:hypothetical protein